MRSRQQVALLYYIGMHAGLNSIQAYNAADGAIRMDGATIALPGYESRQSDFLPFNYTGTRYEINVTDQTMYQLGNHFNCHGKPEMGYASKKEYQQAAYDFALEARKSPNAKIYIGTWNGRGTLNNTQQIFIRLDGKSVIINSSTGQIIDYYVGTDNLGFIDIVEWR